MMKAMDFIFPLLSVVGESVAKTLDKLNYQKYKILPNQLLLLLFSTMVTGLLVSSIFIHQPAPSITMAMICIIATVIIMSFGQNFFDYVGLHTKNLSLREPISNFEPVLAGFLAYMLFPSERNIKYIAAILIGTIILYVSNSNGKLRLEIDKGVVYLFIAVVCSAILASLYKLGLEYVSPYYLLMFRSAGVLLLVGIFFRPRLKTIKKDQAMLGVGTGLVYIVGNLSRLYSIKYLGLNFTIMILVAGPAIIYTSSSLVLKEKVLLKQLVASVAFLIIIIWAVYI